MMSKLTNEEFDDLLKLVAFKTGCQLKKYRHKSFYPTLITIFEDSLSQHILVIRFKSFMVDVNRARYNLGRRINLYCHRVLVCYFLSESILRSEDAHQKKRVIGIYGMSRDRRVNLGIMEVKRNKHRIWPGRITTMGCTEVNHQNLLESFFCGYEEVLTS